MRVKYLLTSNFLSSGFVAALMRLTIQWMRGETATFLKTYFVKLGVTRGGFARVISVVVWLIL